MARFGNSTINPDREEDLWKIAEYVADRSGIKEGRDGVIRIITEIARKNIITTEQLSRDLNLPVPVVAKVNQLFERYCIVRRRHAGLMLTLRGEKLLKNALQVGPDLICPECSGSGVVIPGRLKNFIKRMKTYQKNRKKPKQNMDQFFATTETVMRRAALMHRFGDLEGKRVLLLGDDDLTSVAIARMNLADKITVVDIDPDILYLIEKIAAENGFEIDTVEHDLREPLRIQKHHVFFTDPPYTHDGILLFLRRGFDIADTGYLCYSHKPIGEHLTILQNIVRMNLAITYLMPGFNTYQSMGTFGGRSLVMRLVRAEPVDLPSGLYTGDIKCCRKRRS